MRFVCRYGHAHRTEKARDYCHAERDWQQKSEKVPCISWEYKGTTKKWLETKRYRLWFWPLISARIRRRDKYKCQYDGCNTPNELAVHHIIPRHAKGSDHPENLITLCRKHHGLQPGHHYKACLVLCEADLLREKERLKEEARDKTQRHISEFTR